MSPHCFSPVKSADEAKEELLELYKQSVKRQLLSDVPLGLLAQRRRRFWTAASPDESLREIVAHLYSRLWLELCGRRVERRGRNRRNFRSKHTAVMLDRKTFEDALPHIVSSLEEPIASSSIVPMYFVCKRAREDVKVALVGQGPDELFGGYRRHHGGPVWRACGEVCRDRCAPRLALSYPRCHEMRC